MCSIDVYTFYFDSYISTVHVSVTSDSIWCETSKFVRTLVVEGSRSKQVVSCCVGVWISFSEPPVGTLWYTVRLTDNIMYRSAISFYVERVVTWSNCDVSCWIWKNSYMLYPKQSFYVRYTSFEENWAKFRLLWKTDLRLRLSFF